MTSVEIAIHAKAHLGECVLWCERSHSLFWTDVEARTLYRWDPRNGARQQWGVPQTLASFALCEREHTVLLALAKGIALLDLRSGAIGPIVPVEGDFPTTRINDGRCDGEGRFVFGTFNRVRGAQAIGAYYRVSPDFSIERLPLPQCTVANGIAFSPNGRIVYFADSPTAEIRCAEYAADGTVGPWRTFVRFREGDGYPDGAAVDADGGVWSAHWDGGCVVRYAPDGTESHRIALPVTRPTCVALGGPEFNELFITTATIGLKEEQLQAQPAAGAILRVPRASRGFPERRFGTA
jgi:L-arabinonolactonase